MLPLAMIKKVFPLCWQLVEVASAGVLGWVSKLVVLAAVLIDFHCSDDRKDSALDRNDWTLARVEMAWLGTPMDTEVH